MKSSVIGQVLFMYSDDFYDDRIFIEGKVTKVTPEGVDVFVPQADRVWGKDNQLWQFDTKRERKGHVLWKIDDMPFEERKALLEKDEQERKRGLTNRSPRQFWFRFYLWGFSILSIGYIVTYRG